MARFADHLAISYDANQTQHSFYRQHLYRNRVSPGRRTDKKLLFARRPVLDAARVMASK
jgi:hypothetical protein